MAARQENRITKRTHVRALKRGVVVGTRWLALAASACCWQAFAQNQSLDLSNYQLPPLKMETLSQAVTHEFHLQSELNQRIRDLEKISLSGKASTFAPPTLEVDSATFRDVRIQTLMQGFTSVSQAVGQWWASDKKALIFAKGHMDLVTNGKTSPFDCALLIDLESRLVQLKSCAASEAISNSTGQKRVGDLVLTFSQVGLGDNKSADLDDPEN